MSDRNLMTFAQLIERLRLTQPSIYVYVHHLLDESEHRIFNVLTEIIDILTRYEYIHTQFNHTNPKFGDGFNNLICIFENIRDEFKQPDNNKRRLALKTGLCLLIYSSDSIQKHTNQLFQKTMCIPEPECDHVNINNLLNVLYHIPL